MKKDLISTDGNTLGLYYRNNNNGEKGKKLDFNPARFDYAEEGYSLTHHELYENARDTSLTNYSKLSMTNKIGMEILSKGESVDQADLILYTMIKAYNGNFLHVKDNRIFADESNVEEYDSSYMFKFIKKDGYFTIGHEDKLFKVNPDTFTIELADIKISDKHDLYKFGITRYRNDGKLLIYSMMNQPWGFVFEHPRKEDGSFTMITQEFGKENAYPVNSVKNGRPSIRNVKYSGVKRFWSPFDGRTINEGDLSKDTAQNVIRANGILWKNKRQLPNNNDTYKNMSNYYVFSVGNGSGVDIKAIVLGFDGKVRWVQYHNDFINRFFNQTLSPKVIIDDVSPNFMTDVPYEKELTDKKKLSEGNDVIDWLMTNKKENIDIMQTKNIITPDMNYIRKNEGGNNE